jgi:hypothetical protein
VFVIVVALLMAVAWVRRRGASSWKRSLGGSPLHRRPRRHHRVGDRRRRQDASEEARAFVAMLAVGGRDLLAHLHTGVILQAGETPWAHAQARLATWETQAAQVAASRVRWGGRRVDSTGREVAAGGWQDHGELDWLITSLRLVGRTQANGELISIWWSGLAGAQVNLAGDAVHLDGSNGWRGAITGPGVAPIAVAAVAACHGQEALPVHPGLALLRRPATQTETSRSPEPPALRPGDPMPPTAWSWGNCNEGPGGGPGPGGPRLASAAPAGQPPHLPPPRAPGPSCRDRRQRGDRRAHW